MYVLQLRCKNERSRSRSGIDHSVKLRFWDQVKIFMLSIHLQFWCNVIRKKYDLCSFIRSLSLLSIFYSEVNFILWIFHIVDYVDSILGYSGGYSVLETLFTILQKVELIFKFFLICKPGVSNFLVVLVVKLSLSIYLSITQSHLYSLTNN